MIYVTADIKPIHAMSIPTNFSICSIPLLLSLFSIYYNFPKQQPDNNRISTRHADKPAMTDTIEFNAHHQPPAMSECDAIPDNNTNPAH